MFNNIEDEKIIREIYRETMTRELSRPEIQAGKMKFLAEFYAPAPAPAFSIFSFGFAAPVCAVLALFLLFTRIEVRTVSTAGPSAPMNLMFGTIMEEAKAKRAQELADAQAKADAQRQAKQAKAGVEDPLENHMKPRVVVKRVSSQMGPTMVYQRSYQDVPVTIVWVFSNGGSH